MTAGDRSSTPLDVSGVLGGGAGLSERRLRPSATGNVTQRAVSQNTGCVYQPPPRIQPHSGVPPQGLVAVRPVACRGAPVSVVRCSVGHLGGAVRGCDRLGERYASAPALVLARKCYGSSELTTTNTVDTMESLQPGPDRNTSLTSALHNSLDRRLFTRNPSRLQMHQAPKLSGSTNHLWQPQQLARNQTPNDAIYRDSPPLLTPSPSDSGFASGMENNISATGSASKRDRAPLSIASSGRNNYAAASSSLRRNRQEDTPSCCAYQDKTVQDLEQRLGRAEQEVCALRSRLEEALWEQGRRRGETALMRAQLRETRNALSARELELLRLRHEIRHNCNCPSNNVSACSTEPCAESQQLRRELEAKCAEFENERQRWQNEKDQVLRYQRCLLNQLRNKVLPDE